MTILWFSTTKMEERVPSLQINNNILLSYKLVTLIFLSLMKLVALKILLLNLTVSFWHSIKKILHWPLWNINKSRTQSLWRNNKREAQPNKQRNQSSQRTKKWNKPNNPNKLKKVNNPIKISKTNNSKINPSLKDNKWALGINNLHNLPQNHKISPKKMFQVSGQTNSFLWQFWQTKTLTNLWKSSMFRHQDNTFLYKCWKFSFWQMYCVFMDWLKRQAEEKIMKLQGRELNEWMGWCFWDFTFFALFLFD